MPRKITLPTLEDFNSIPAEALVPENEQPYSIPAEWKWVWLGSVINLLSGRDEPLSSCNSDGSGIPYLMGASNFCADGLLFERWIEEPKVISKRGDLLLTVKGTVGKMVIQTDPEVNLSRQVMALQVSHLLDVRFLKYFLETVTGTLEQQAVGLIPGISREVLLRLPIVLPTLEEQKQIIKQIKTRTEKIDKVLEKLEGFLVKAESRTEGLLSAALEGYLTGGWREKNEVSRDSWKCTTLGEAFKWSSGGTPSRKNPDYYIGTIPWIKSGELNDALVTETEEHISELAIKESSAKVFPKGSVAIAMYGATIGRVGKLGMDAATNQAVAVAQKAEHSRARYLLLFLRANRNRFIALGKGGAQSNISQQIIKAFPYQIPSLAEQDEIIRLVELSLDRLAQAETLITRLLVSMRQAKNAVAASAMAGRFASKSE